MPENFVFQTGKRTFTCFQRYNFSRPGGCGGFKRQVGISNIPDKRTTIYYACGASNNLDSFLIKYNIVIADGMVYAVANNYENERDDVNKFFVEQLGWKVGVS
jgi:hypothetical protein